MAARPLTAPKAVPIRQPNLPTRVRTEIWEMARDARRLEAFIQLSFARLIAAAASDWLEAARLALLRGDPNPAALLPEVSFTGHGSRVAGHVRDLSAALAMAEIAGRLRVRKQAGVGEGLVPSRFAESFPQNVSTADLERYIRSLPAVERSQWEAFIRKHQGAAFTVSGVNNRAVLGDLRDLVARSLEARLTPEQFDRAARELLRNYQVSGARLRTVWNQTVSNAIREARAEEVRDPEVRAALPFALYDAILDARVRPNHAAMEGAIAPLDWWEGQRSDLEPPLGFSCRCQLLYMNSVRARKLTEQGEPYFRIDLDGPRAGAGPDTGFVRFSEVGQGLAPCREVAA